MELLLEDNWLSKSIHKSEKNPTWPRCHVIGMVNGESYEKGKLKRVAMPARADEQEKLQRMISSLQVSSHFTTTSLCFSAPAWPSAWNTRSRSLCSVSGSRRHVADWCAKSGREWCRKYDSRVGPRGWAEGGQTGME